MQATNWKCNRCDLYNPINNIKCQACFTLSPRARITTILLMSYFRENERKLTIVIPQLVRITIMNFIEKSLIFAIGRNHYGQMGQIHYIQLRLFTRLYALESLVNNINDIYANDAVLFIKSNNKIYAAGWNSHCQTGIAQTYYPTAVTTWTQIEELNDVDIISRGIANSYHTYITTLDGTLYVNGSPFSEASIVRLHKMDTRQWLKDTDRIKSIVCGSKHTIFQTEDNHIYAYGDNTYGQCIIDRKQEHIRVPLLVDLNVQLAACGDWFTALLTAEGIAKCVGDISHIVYLQNNKKVINIKCGARHCLLLDNKGSVYSLGDNSCGQRGYRNIDFNEETKEIYCIDVKEEMMDIECGGDHSVLLSTSNNMVVFGYNGFKQCSTVIEDECIFGPQYFDKKKELGEEYVIQKVICLHNETLLVIDPFA